MFYTKRTKKVLNFVFNFYKNKDIKTKDGLNAIFHVFRVANDMATESSTIVALLHDYLEDGGDIKLLENLITIEEENAICLISRNINPSYTYVDYIKSLADNPITLEVKIADLEDNLDITRIEISDRKKYSSLVKRYEKALGYLVSELRKEDDNNV